MLFLPPNPLLSPPFHVLSAFNNSITFSVQRNLKKKKEHPKLKGRGWWGAICRNVEAPKPQRWYTTCSSEVNLVGAAEKSVSPDAPHSTWEPAAYSRRMGKGPTSMPLGAQTHWKQNAPLACHLSTGSWGYTGANVVPILWHKYLRSKYWVLWEVAWIDAPRAIKVRQWSSTDLNPQFTASVL